MHNAHRAIRVCFFEDRAEVEREFEALAGTQTVILGGLSPLIDDPSLMTSYAGGKVLAAGVERQSRVETPGQEELRRIEESVWQAEREVTACNQAIVRMGDKIERLQALMVRLCEGLALVPQNPALPRLPLQEALEEFDSLYLKKDEAEAALLLARARLGAAQTGTPRQETRVVLSIEGSGGPVRVRYLVPCALWRPAHRARLLPNQRVEFENHAVVWQATGEDWEGIEAVFSTARVGRAASPPKVEEDVLRLRARTTDAVRVEIREELVQSVASGGKTRDTTELPGVDDGGSPVRFGVTGVSFFSDGRGVWVPLGSQALEAAVEAIAWPEKGAGVFLQARCVAKAAVLPGPVQAIRVGAGGESLMGVGKTSFVPMGEPFFISFGLDDGLRVRRQVEEKTETSLLGVQHRQVVVRVTVSNLGGAPREVVLCERVLVSEIGEVRVTIQEGGAPDKDGFLRKNLAVAGGESGGWVVRYGVEMSGRVVG